MPSNEPEVNYETVISWEDGSKVVAKGFRTHPTMRWLREGHSCFCGPCAMTVSSGIRDIMDARIFLVEHRLEHIRQDLSKIAEYLRSSGA